MNDSAIPPARLRRIWRWTCRSVAATALVLVVAFVVWAFQARSAFNNAMAQLKAQGEPIAPADFAEPDIPDADNGAIDIRAAMALCAPERKEYAQATDHRSSLGRFADERDRRQAQALVDAYRDALDRAAPAFGKPGVNWNMALPSDQWDLAPSANLKGARTLAMIMAADARLAQARGDDAAMLEDCRRVLLLSRILDRKGGALVSHLVAVGIDALGAGVLERFIPDVRIEGAAGSSGGHPASAAAVRDLIKLLLDDVPMAAAQKRAMQGERCFLVWMITHASSKSDTAGKTNGAAALPSGPARPLFIFWPFVYTDARLLAQSVSDLALHVDGPDLPTAMAAATTAQRINKAFAEHPKLHLLASTMTPSLRRAVGVHYRAMTENHLCAIALAMRLYSLDHQGNLPADLAELVPAYLPAIPADGLASGAPPRYLPRPGDPILYSVGENGRDDGGSEKPWNQRSSSHPTGGPLSWKAEDFVMHLVSASAATRPSSAPAD